MPRPNSNGSRRRRFRRPNSSGNGNSQSTGPSVKVRGSSKQIHEKYLHLARDAKTSGDEVLFESYSQHAEHYARILIEAGKFDSLPSGNGEYKEKKISNADNSKNESKITKIEKDTDKKEVETDNLSTNKEATSESPKVL